MKKHTQLRFFKRIRRKGFTLVELVVVIAVIAILATLAVLGLNVYLHESRDSQREANVTVLAEALEKYYDTHGEYPSCSAISATPSAVATTIGVDQAVLKAPGSSVDNSFVCAALNASSTAGQYAYTGGDTSAECLSGGSCLEWTIQYKNESDGSIIALSSRRKASFTTSGSVVVTATPASNTQINLSWNTVPNALSYTVERSLSQNMAGATSANQTTTAANITSLVAGTRYYFRVTPQQVAQAGTPGLADAVTTISAPTGTIATVPSLQTSNTVARGTASGVTCAAGTTLQYAHGYEERNTNSAIVISYGAWGTSATRDVTAQQGYNYTLQSKARCVGSDATSSEVESAQVSVTRPINQPALPTYAGDTSMAAGYRYSSVWNGSCPAGTSYVNGSVRMYNAGFGGNSGNNTYPGSGGTYGMPSTEWWYLGWAAGQNSIDIYYYTFYSCQTVFATSPQSGTQTTVINVYCEAGRRSYSASPRCDSHGQDGNSLPWGP